MDRKITPSRQRTPSPIIERANELLNAVPRPTYAAIARDLALEFPDKSPTAKAISEWQAKGWIGTSEDDAPWSMTDDSPEDAALVLPSLRLADTERKNWAAQGWPLRPRWRPTKRQASWIVRIRRTAPAIDIGLTIGLAIHASRGGVEFVESVLAYEPWRDEGAAFFGAVDTGLISDTDAFRTLGLYIPGYGQWLSERAKEDK